MNKRPLSVVHNCDCLTAMKDYSDNYFDLAIVDPPYGIGAENHAGNKDNGWTQWAEKSWDAKIPEREYFNELLRVSKNQIVWGGNYFVEYLPAKMGWIFWDKGQRGFSLADGELAWTSYNKALRVIDYPRALANQEDKIHPTQKPVEIYKRLLRLRAKQGDLILDTHLGSGSSRIAAYQLGFDFIGYELDKEYYDAQEKRFNHFISQEVLF